MEVSGQLNGLAALVSRIRPRYPLDIKQNWNNFSDPGVQGKYRMVSSIYDH
jgi:hypothetical protein